MIRKFRLVAALLLLSILPVLCQTAPRAHTEVEGRVESLLKLLSLEEKIDLIGGVDDFYIRDIQHIHLPRLKMSDGPVGVRNYGPSTAVGGIALAATWAPELARRVGQGCGRDARARGVHCHLGQDLHT